MTVTLPVTLPFTLLALALGGLGATLGIDGSAFLDLTDGENDGVDWSAGGSHVFDEAGDAHRSPSLGRIRMSASRYEREFAQPRKGVGALARWVDSYGRRVGVLE